MGLLVARPINPRKVILMGYSSKVPVRKITDDMWEIPQDYKPGMRVPGRVYADDSLMEKMGEDLTLLQCTNVAQLPGIQKYSIVMPDGHQGYGFPIGGVAAFDSEEGVISPGGVGYDINCLPAGSRVLTPDGYRVPIEEALSHGRVTCMESARGTPAKVVLGLKKSDRSLYRITTRSGLAIRATGDHPILTKQGMVRAESLAKGVQVATHPFQGADYEAPPPMDILDQGSFSPDIGKELSLRKLLPLRADSKALPALLRLLGYFMGDGTFDGEKTIFYGRREGLELLRADIEYLGFKPSPVYTAEVCTFIGHQILTGAKDAVHVSSGSFRALLEGLGAPSSSETAALFSVPGWIMRMPRYLQRCLLSGYFGASMDEPQTVKGYNFEPPVVSCTTLEPAVDCGIDFLSRIGSMLGGFGVEVCGILRKDFGDRTLLMLQLSEKPPSLINLWSKVGYSYSPEKQRLALAAVSWLGWKCSVVSRAPAAAAAQVCCAGGSSVQAAEEPGCGRVNRRSIERGPCGGLPTSPRLPIGFPRFERWAESSLEEDIVWDEVESVEAIPGECEVFDITVDSPSHNFVAEGFVVSNCGVRLVLTNLNVKDVRPALGQLVDNMFNLVPSGLGSKGGIRLNPAQLDEVLDMGVHWAIEKGYGWEEDARRCEEGGQMRNADHTKVSIQAKGRGGSQLGTLGSGNHFLEVQVVEKIYDPRTAKAFGVTEEQQVVVMIHTGSRGMGHQVCSDYLHTMERIIPKYGLKVPDRELVYAPASSPEAAEYFAAMSAACNYAWANRQCIMHWTREAFQRTFRTDPEKLGMRLVYDVAHNLAKREEHTVDGKRRTLYVHRKGATRAFPPGRPEVTEEYREVGQPVIIPGSMGTASYLLVGGPNSLELSWGSTAHGAGRFLSREAAKRKYWGDAVRKELESKGVRLRAADMRVIAEEAPGAYKDVNRVVDVSNRLGIATLVARLAPIGVTKG